MSRSLTTLIDIEFNFTALSQKYDLYKVTLESCAGKVDYAKQIRSVDAVSTPKALVRHSGHYWVLLDKSNKPATALTDIAFEYVELATCDTLLLGRLLVRALGKVAENAFFSGLGETYLFVEPEKFNEHIVYKCIKFELKESVRFNSLFIEFS